MFESISGDMNGSIMPGWEPERMAHVKELFEMYKDVDDEKLFANLKYFLEKIMPVCDKYDIKWLFTQMIQHGAYLDFHVLSSTKKISCV